VPGGQQGAAVGLRPGGGGRRGVRAGGAQRVQPLGRRAAPHAQLQVLLRPEGLDDAARRPDRQAQRAAALPHHQQRADVRRPDLRVPPGAPGPDRQAALAAPLAAPHRAVGEGGGNVVQLGLVELLLDALTEVLKDDGDLTGSKVTPSGTHNRSRSHRQEHTTGQGHTVRKTHQVKVTPSRTHTRSRSGKCTMLRSHS
uniref:Uncharacterized protein n=1 Tax=Salarias fasciatus TaxID=181472 RepID=A0A672HYX6_SALFA